MIEELSELHDHVRESGIGQVRVGVVLLRNESRVGKCRGSSAASGNAYSILKSVL